MTMGNLTPLSVFSFIGGRNPVYSINIHIYVHVVTNLYVA